MSTTLSYTTTSYYDKGLQTFSKAVAPVKHFSTEFYGEAIIGNSVSVPLVNAGQAKEFIPASGYVPAGGISEIDIPLKHFENTMSINVTQSSTNVAAKLENLYDAQLRSIAEGISTYILADVANFTAAATGVAPGSFGYDTVKLAQAGLDAANVGGNRVLLTNGEYTAALSPSTTDNIRLSVNDYGFEGHYRAPLTSGVGALAINPACYAVATTLPQNPLIGTNALIEHNVITDPDSNISIQHIVFADAQKGKIFSTFEVRGGGKIGINAGVKVTAA